MLVHFGTQKNALLFYLKDDILSVFAICLTLLSAPNGDSIIISNAVSNIFPLKEDPESEDKWIGCRLNRPSSP
jgi:hypothetical protein